VISAAKAAGANATHSATAREEHTASEYTGLLVNIATSSMSGLVEELSNRAPFATQPAGRQRVREQIHLAAQRAPAFTSGWSGLAPL
jgi:hypothetical protein